MSHDPPSPRLPRLVVLLDDKSYGLQQVLRALPRDATANGDVEVRHIDRWSTWLADPPSPFILLLDYFLDKDGLVGADIVHQIETATHLVGFSSVLRCSHEIANRATACGRFQSVHAVLKRGDDARNQPLETVLMELLALPGT